MDLSRLTQTDLEANLSQLTDWTIVEGKLHRQFKFRDFVGAFGFMSSMALVSERLGHHPEWFNVYNRVTVDLVTHDADGITRLDIEWATIADQIFGP